MPASREGEREGGRRATHEEEKDLIVFPGANESQEGESEQHDAGSNHA